MSHKGCIHYIPLIDCHLLIKANDSNTVTIVPGHLYKMLTYLIHNLRL